MYKNASYIPLMRFGLLLLGLLSCFWFLACDPERKKKCEWTLEQAQNDRKYKDKTF